MVEVGLQGMAQRSLFVWSLAVRGQALGTHQAANATLRFMSGRFRVVNSQVKAYCAEPWVQLLGQVVPS